MNSAARPRLALDVDFAVGGNFDADIFDDLVLPTRTSSNCGQYQAEQRSDEQLHGSYRTTFDARCRLNC